MLLNQLTDSFTIKAVVRSGKCQLNSSARAFDQSFLEKRRMAASDLIYSALKIVKAGGTALISTGIKMQIPSPFFGKIEGRSGLAYRCNVHIGGGVIDRDYRGEIQVILVNAGDLDFQ
ncbi:dUTPase-like protein, partial [Leptotrombidium deliense]